MVKTSKYCTNCKNEVKNTDTYCYNCGKQLKIKKNKKANKFLILGAIIIIILPAIIINKDKIVINHYLTKAKKQENPVDAINYYAKALKINYRPDIIFNIGEMLKNDKNIDEHLKILELVLEPKDLNKIASDAYVEKAEKSFENENLEETISYLNSAVKYNFDVTRFKYYDKIDSLDEMMKNQDELLVKNEENITQETEETQETEKTEEIKEVKNDKEYFIQDSNVRYLTEEELSQYTKEELPFIRNEIFARHGYIFSNEKYSSYFESKDWYTPNPDFKGNPDELNNIEYQNIKLIKSME